MAGSPDSDFTGIELGLEYTLKYILPQKECVPSVVWNDAHSVLELLERSCAWVMCYDHISLRFEINHLS